ncbi:Regulatory protein cys-3 [Lachnellula willkommii]|uniref:Regulatory protein cys-3 n=1 Tax=Lachnellula willkommii TaxID=215461 RepID=A0A559M3T2_9HELO|nr:Regulatory protein cys-3 [Lachnellula willkommii]
MHNQHPQQHQHQYPPINPAYDPSFYPSSTDSTPPSGFYINTHHNNPQTIQPQHGGQSYPHQILSPTSSTSTTDPDSEQKRLRNTAASARFRAKKKRREQSLERSSTEKRQQVQRLEHRVGELEEENRSGLGAWEREGEEGEGAQGTG